MITILGTALVNWNALGKIILAALIGGTGVVIVFGFLLLGISRGRTANSPTQRYALFTFSGLCGVLCVAVAAIGIYAITQKPSTAKPKPMPKAAAALAPAATARRLATGLRVE